MREIVVADIGGTHARFALAEVAGGRVVRLHEPVTLRTASYAGLEPAWQAFAARLGRPLPRAAAIALAGPVEGSELRLTNSRWTIHPALLGQRLGVDAHVLLNDFGAIGHALAQGDPAHLLHVCGPDAPLSAEGVTSIVGPGTGLGVAQLLRRAGHLEVIATEGGHIAFAPLDALEDRLLSQLRARYGRVSAERLLSGAGLPVIHEALGGAGGEERAVWRAALEGGDAVAADALERFCLILGAVAGDIALAHGANGVVIAGGLGQRLGARLPASGFAQRFAAKGRFEARMRAMPVKLITHPQPGLYGAAAAFARAHPDGLAGAAKSCDAHQGLTTVH